MPVTSVTKYYAGGQLISVEEKEQLASGKGKKRIYSPAGQPGVPFAILHDTFKKWDQSIDPDDKELKAILKGIGLPLEKTFIVETAFSDGLALTAVYYYTEKGAE